MRSSAPAGRGVHERRPERAVCGGRRQPEAIAPHSGMLMPRGLASVATSRHPPEVEFVVLGRRTPHRLSEALIDVILHSTHAMGRVRSIAQGRKFDQGGRPRRDHAARHGAWPHAGRRRARAGPQGREAGMTLSLAKARQPAWRRHGRIAVDAGAGRSASRTAWKAWPGFIGGLASAAQPVATTGCGCSGLQEHGICSATFAMGLRPGPSPPGPRWTARGASALPASLRLTHCAALERPTGRAPLIDAMAVR